MTIKKRKAQLTFFSLSLYHHLHKHEHKIKLNKYINKKRRTQLKALLILLMSAFICKKSTFFGKDSTFTQSNSVRAMLEIF